MQSTQSIPKPTSAPPDEKERLFQCSTCQRSFTRVDHLMRHVRSHTKQRPYVCPTCSKGFARVDLLKRHAENHSSDRANKRQRTEIVRQSRVVQACEACSQHHLRCEDDKPCSRCQKKKIVCRLPDSDQSEIDAAQDLMNLSNDMKYSTPQSAAPSNDASASQPPFHPAGQETAMTAPHADGIDPNLLSDVQSTAGSSSMQGPYVDDAMMPFVDETMMPMDDDSPIDPLLPDYVRNMQQLETSLSGFATPRENMDLGFHWDMDFNSFDFSLLEQYNFQDPLHGMMPNDVVPTTTQQPAPEPDHHDDAAARAEAFKGSVWRYMPLRNLNPLTAEESNLTIADGDKDHQTRTNISPRRVLNERLSHTSRDKMLALVLNTSDPSNLKRISSKFPSLELLDSMLQVFIGSPAISASWWFHIPTFSPAKINPELLACMVAAGAFSMPDTALQKLGLALQEATRIGVGKVFDDDNSAIRDLQYLQVQLLQIEVGMWSGISRKMEIAESFLQPPVTMLRRGGRFRRAVWKNIAPTSDDYGAALQRKWMEWVAQESWLRLIYRFFECDRQSSIALLKPPLISYAEMQLPLPQSNSLWFAPSASAWKSAYLANSPVTTRKLPTAYDLLHDLGHLGSYGPASTTYLYMVWGLIWEYRQIAALTKKTSTDSLLLSSRYAELSKYCEDFRVNSFASDKHADMTLEVILVHLEAPMDDIQTFAGIAGPDEARHAYPPLRDWISTMSARKAIWHAAQVLRIAQSLPKGLLCDFYATAVYQAGLVVWLYGLLKRPGAEKSSGEMLGLVTLNGEENLEIKRFIKLDRGEPALRYRHSHDTDTIAPLSNPSEVIKMAKHILLQNHDAAEGALPLLVESLVQLMEGLRSATKP